MEVVNEKEKSLSFADVLGVLRSGIVWIIVITILCTLIGGVYAFAFKKTTYTSKLSAMIYVETYKNPVTGEDEEVAEHTRYQYAALIAEEIGTFLLSPAVMNACGENIKGSLSVSPKEEQPIFTVSYSFSRKGGDVKAIKEEIASSLNDYIDKAVQYLNVSEDVFKWYSGKIVVFSYAQAKDVAVSSNKIGVVLIALVIGLALSVVFVLIKNAFDDTLKTKEQIEAITGNQIIALIDISENQNVEKKPISTGEKEEN